MKKTIEINMENYFPYGSICNLTDDFSLDGSVLVGHIPKRRDGELIEYLVEGLPLAYACRSGQEYGIALTPPNAVRSLLGGISIEVHKSVPMSKLKKKSHLNYPLIDGMLNILTKKMDRKVGQIRKMLEAVGCDTIISFYQGYRRMPSTIDSPKQMTFMLASHCVIAGWRRR